MLVLPQPCPAPGGSCPARVALARLVLGSAHLCCCVRAVGRWRADSCVTVLRGAAPMDARRAAMRGRHLTSSKGRALSTAALSALRSKSWHAPVTCGVHVGCCPFHAHVHAVPPHRLSGGQGSWAAWAARWQPARAARAPHHRPEAMQHILVPPSPNWCAPRAGGCVLPAPSPPPAANGRRRPTAPSLPLLPQHNTGMAPTPPTGRPRWACTPMEPKTRLCCSTAGRRLRAQCWRATPTGASPLQSIACCCYYRGHFA